MIRIIGTWKSLLLLAIGNDLYYRDLPAAPWRGKFPPLAGSRYSGDPPTIKINVGTNLICANTYARFETMP